MLSTFSPVGVHFDRRETRLLQIERTPRRKWRVRSAAVRSSGTEGDSSNWRKDLKTIGRDATVALPDDDISVSLVPVEAADESRLHELLGRAAMQEMSDEAGLTYRYLPLSTTQERGSTKQEYLLMVAGNTAMNRCVEGVESHGLRAVGVETTAFAIARALIPIEGATDQPWGFLHIGAASSMFGIVHLGEIAFLKPVAFDTSRVEDLSLQTVATYAATGTDGGAVAAPPQAGLVDLRHALRLDAEALAQEVRGCMRHFSSRNKGVRVESVTLSGSGMSLEGVADAVSSALDLKGGLARPFTALGIAIPPEIAAAEHLWVAALGLAMRGL